MIRVLLLEDERSIARHTMKLVETLMGPQWCRMEHCEDLAEAIAKLNGDRYNLVLLDLNLNGDDGFALLEAAVSGDYQTIVVSAHSERALEAFDYGVLDFVPKPVDPQRLQRALQRFRDAAKSNHAARFLAFKSFGKVEMVPLKGVVYMRGAGHYAEVTIEDGRQLLHQKSLESLEVILPDGFYRIHKSYIANMAMAKSIKVQSGGRYELLLADGSRLPIGRSRYKNLTWDWFA